ncbi:MAG: hypothetical protein ABIS67_13145, partial [Candidatus Eisenbacteria bacterium]
HSLRSGALQPARARDGFEEELHDVAIEGVDGHARAAARGALFLKGRVRGDYLLTLAVDSEREVRERLFRDIRPDEFYPIYGDASIREYDAQSASRLYVRVDRKRSYLLYGDYTTAAGGEARELGAYHRSLNGVLEHFESEAVKLNAFASQGRSSQVVEEIPGRGVSGPYALGHADGVVNSEQVEILTRDRNQPSRVLKSVRLTRFADYRLEPFTGRLLFNAPVPSVDDQLNPVTIRVTYEVEHAIEYPTYGVDAQARVGKFLEVGGSAVRDEHPIEDRRLLSGNASLHLGPTTRLIFEAAQTDSAEARVGEAGRVELRHASRHLDATLFGSRTDREFSNPSTLWAPGRTELGLRGTAVLDSATRIRAEALRTEDRTTNGRRDGAAASVERRFGSAASLELGYRHAEETTTPATATTAGATPNVFNSLRGRLGLGEPGLRRAQLFGEYEQDLADAERFRAQVGADYRFAGRGALYARHEWIRSFAGPYALHPDRELLTTVVGLEGEYMHNGQAFSEYRIRDAMDGREGEAAVGLRNRWSVARGVRLDTSFERITPTMGSGPIEATAVTAGVNCTRDPRSKASGRVEFRTSPAGDDWLGTIGYARKLNRDLALLGKGLWSDAGSLSQARGRAQLGLAFRQTDVDRWSALTRYEFRLERENHGPGMDLDHSAHVLAADLNHQPGRRVHLSLHLAGKLATDQSNGLETGAQACWLATRAVMDIYRAWDAGLLVSSRFTDGFTSHRDGLGVELGQTVATNLRIAAGYNLLGYKDDDLTGRERTDHGAYLNLRFKFDEDLFGLRAGTQPPANGDQR